MDISPFWAILIPVIGAILIALIKEEDDWSRNTIAVCTTIITFILVATAFPKVVGGETFSFTLFQISQGLSISFTAGAAGHDICHAGVHAVDFCHDLLHRLHVS
jgi:NADH:ubiquinone oxidoreductase subunit 4 (subunit M)